MNHNLQREEVMKMADKKSTCGCGCIPPMKQNSTKATKDKKKAKESK